jgi:hypothetical protein
MGALIRISDHVLDDYNHDLEHIDPAKDIRSAVKEILNGIAWSGKDQTSMR